MRGARKGRIRTRAVGSRQAAHQTAQLRSRESRILTEQSESEFAICAVELDQALGGGVLGGEGVVVLGDGRGDLLGQLLAELDAPLIVGVEAPHGAFHEGDVLVQGDELADCERGQGHTEDGGGRTVAGEHAGRDDLLRGTLGAHFVSGLAERQGLGLGEVVAQEQLVHVLVAVLGRVRGVDERDEVGRDELGALVDQLVEGVLAVGARFAPEDLAGLGGDGGAVPTHGLAVGLHGQLLQVGREAVQVLVVRQHGVGGDLEEVAVPDVQHTEQHHDVLLERGVGEVLIDLVEAVQELLETSRAEDHGQGGADGGVDGVTAADPVPEAERVVRVDAEFGDLLQVGGDGDEVLLDGFGVLLVGAVDGALGLELFEQPGAGFTGVGQGLRVVKVLETMMNRVVSGSRPLVFSARSFGSMLEM